MDRERWQRVRALFDQLVDLPPQEREAGLDALLPDQALRADVQALLDQVDQATAPDFGLAARAPALMDAFASDSALVAEAELAGQMLGPWRLIRPIGEGGMGEVYLAERDDGQYRQQAAVKLVRVGWSAAALLERTRAERQMLASLNHPNIARLLDGGSTGDGKPYLVLEYVDGHSVTEYCDNQGLGLRQRLRLFLSVCDAVAHAHGALIVHRDLKPSNIMVDASGTVKLLDFGIAKLMQDGAEKTATGTRLFTPEYAAPEQVRGEPVTVAVDVYALGVVLYVLLTGLRPYAITGNTPAAYEHAILSQEPTRASKALSTSGNDDARTRRSKRASVMIRSAELRGDLDAILLKALRKNPTDRYRSVPELAADIQAYLDKRPVAARRGNRSYLLRRWLERNALAAALSSLAVAALLLGSGLAFWQAQEARSQRDQAEIGREQARIEARRAEATVDFLTQVFSQADPSETGGQQILATDLLLAGERQLAQADQHMDAATRVGLGLAVSRAYLGLQDGEAMIRVATAAAEAAEVSGQPRLEVKSLVNLATAYSLAQHYGDAERWATLAEQRFMSAALEDSLLEADLLLMKASLTSIRGQQEASLPIFDSAYRITVAETGLLSPQSVSIMSAYVYSLVRLGRGDDLLALTTPVLDALYAAQGVSKTLEATVLACHAAALMQHQDWEGAEALVRRALQLESEVYGEHHSKLIYHSSLLVALLGRMNRHQESAEVAERTLALNRRGINTRMQMEATLAGVTRVQLLAGNAARARELAEETLALMSERGTLDTQLAFDASRHLAESLLLLSEHDAAAEVVSRLEEHPVLQFDGVGERNQRWLVDLQQRVAQAAARITP